MPWMITWSPGFQASPAMVGGSKACVSLAPGVSQVAGTVLLNWYSTLVWGLVAPTVNVAPVPLVQVNVRVTRSCPRPACAETTTMDPLGRGGAVELLAVTVTGGACLCAVVVTTLGAAIESIELAALAEVLEADVED
jgi:hypothetical protein